VESALHQLEQVPKPTIALLQGAAVGGGAAIALACDMRIAAENLRFGVPIARTVGNCLSANNLNRLIDVVGPALTLELIYTGRLIEAGEAMDVGLVSRVTSLADAEAEATALAESLSSHAPLTLHATKRMMSLINSARRAQSQGPEMEELVQRVYDSADFREGISAFVEHRSPIWTGK
jgi:enoyl-CoA hydratase/carnithine racemase